MAPAINIYLAARLSENKGLFLSVRVVIENAADNRSLQCLLSRELADAQIRQTAGDAQPCDAFFGVSVSLRENSRAFRLFALPDRH